MSLENLGAAISGLNGFVWGLPLMVMLVGAGLYFSISLGWIQLRGFRHAVNVLRGKYDNPDDPGEVSHFRALSTALSATIGTGNIVGVAAAIMYGGPGAVFWMWVTAFVGMATKFCSCTLAVHFRRIDERGETHGGPMHYIELGMGPDFKWLAVLFAIFTAIASFGIGNMFQINSIAAAVDSLLRGADAEPSYTVRLVTGMIIAVLVACVILGGIKRIAALTSKIVPFMCAFYILGGLIILTKNVAAVPVAFKLIFYHAFHAPEAVTGGLLGGVIRCGVARGLFSNEAGLGSAAMAHGAARTKEPVREGLVAMLGPFIDTIVVCSITALVIITTGAYETATEKALLTRAAFETGLPGMGWMVSVGMILFAFSTLVSWPYYGDRAVDYLFGRRAVTTYRWIFVAIIVVGAISSFDMIVNLCDAMNGLMALPNLIALVALSPVLVKLARDYMTRNG
ncbi:alanine/glycine:cation symporter family protein [Candidatus Hydrogenedentota bacterium]